MALIPAAFSLRKDGRSNHYKTQYQEEAESSQKLTGHY